jgi:hypothetical protein
MRWATGVYLVDVGAYVETLLHRDTACQGVGGVISARSWLAWRGISARDLAATIGRLGEMGVRDS